MTVTLERQSTKYGNDGLLLPLLLSTKLVECPEALRPWLYTLLDGQAALALESIDIKDMCMEGGEQLVFRELDQRFPDKVAAVRVGGAMEEAFELKIMKNETTEGFAGRSRLVFTRLQSEGAKLPSEVRGYFFFCVDVDLRACVGQR